MAYPETPRQSVEEILHGVPVQDPYRWLEDAANEAVRAWEDQQHQATREALDGRAEVALFRQRWRVTAGAGAVGPMTVRGRYLYYQARRRDEQQPVLLRRPVDGSDDARVILDPNRAEASGLIALDWYYPSRDGQLLAYGYSEAGDEWSTLRVRDIDAGRDLGDTIPRTRYASLVWWPDRQGFYYTRYPEPGSVPPGEENYRPSAYAHRLGTDWRADPLIFTPEGRRELPWLSLSDDGHYLLITTHAGWDASTLRLADLTDDGAWHFRVLDVGEGLHAADFHDQTLYIMTDQGAERGRMLAMRLSETGASRLEELVPQHPSWTLRGFESWGNGLLLSYLEDGASRVIYWDGSRKSARIGLPDLGTVSALAVGDSGPAFIRYESLAEPPSILACDAPDSPPRVVVPAPLPPTAAQVRRVWATSSDGTRISVIVLGPADPVVPRPTILTGYGGFNIAMTPTYNPDARVWAEAGGYWALAALRGGGEYGAAWHRAGMFRHKQNVFDDCRAALASLVEAGLTTRRQLGLLGGSNGGLLVTAVITQWPDSVRAAVASVPLTDMLRFHKVLIGDLWTKEYGSADNPADFPYLLAYSPYHRVAPGTRYPATLMTTARRDSRVDPMHARKMTAALQHAQAGDAPIWLRIESDAGHGQGMPLAKQAELRGDVLGFLASELGLRPVDA